MDGAVAERRGKHTGQRAMLVALAAVAALLGVLALTGTGAEQEAGRRGVDAGAVVLVVVGVGFAVAGRRTPTTGAFGNLATTLAWYLAGYTNWLINIPFLAAYFLLGATGDRRRQLAVGGTTVVLTGMVMVGTTDQSAASVASAIGWTLAALLFGEVTYSRRALLAELEARAERAEAERDMEAERRVAQVRLEIARDIHDVLAHTVSLMTVQAGVGQDALARGDLGAERALRTIRAAGRDAMAEIQALVAVLRGGGDHRDTAPAPRLGQIPELVESTQAAGVDVELALNVAEGQASEVAELTAFRIVQESLTNVVRHAPGASARVVVHTEGGDLVVDVCNDNNGGGRHRQVGITPSGFGVSGMRERVASLGGTVHAGPVGSGWRVTARIPRDRRRRE